MDEETKPIKKPADEEGQSKSAAAITAYDSNPFTAAWTGIQKLRKLNANTAFGVALFDILLFILIGAIGAALGLATVAFFAKRYGDAMVPGGLGFDFLHSMNYLSIYATWLIGVATIILLIMLIQLLQMQITLASAKGVETKFGALFKNSKRCILSLLGLAGLVLLIVAAAIMGMAAIGSLLGPAGIVLVPIVIAAGIYVGLRLAFVSYIIVDQDLGPIEATRQSWQLSNSHIIETTGSAAVSWLILVVPSMVLAALAKASEAIPVLAGIFNILYFLAIIVLVIVASMALAERYVQLRTAASKQVGPAGLNSLNFVAILLVIIVAPIVNILLSDPKPDTRHPDSSDWYYDKSSPEIFDKQNQPSPFDEQQAPTNAY